MERLVLKGRVFTGKTEGTQFIGLRRVERQIEEKLGFVPYHGTLNVRLTEASIIRRKALVRAKGIDVLPAKGYCHGRLFRAHLDSVECAVILPEVADYPEGDRSHCPSEFEREA